MMNKINSVYISVLTTDDYLPGILVLNHSLNLVNSRYDLHVLLTPNISEQTIRALDSNLISYSVISREIVNPTNVNVHHRWFPTYSKLAVFDQTQYKKVVYLDADMLILRNVDELFGHAHMSATNAGGMLPRKTNPRHLGLNSGLIVIEPSHFLFKDMMSKVGKIENLRVEGNTERPVYGSDQDFINAYFSEWPNQKELHLDHKFNIFHYHLDEYNKLFGYTIGEGPRPISIIHYASYLKPWNIDRREISKLEHNHDKKLELEAISIWIENQNNLVNVGLS